VGQLEAFIAALDVVDVDIDVARQYAQTRSYLRARGLLIPENDLWIAATALTYDFVLVSRDEHFSRVEDLKLYEP
jgi:tRNA(fMet)-specific endonuclease VapC